MTQPAYTDADVELVAGWFRRWLGASTIRQRDRDCAIEILGALAAAGRLIPAGASSQWTIRVNGRPVESYAGFTTEANCRQVAARDPDGNVTVASRVVGPWINPEEPA